MKLIRLGIPVTFWGLVAAASAMGGCSDHRGSSSHLLVASEAEPERTSEQEWLHKLQMVTVVKTGDANSASMPSEMEPRDFSTRVNAECSELVMKPLNGLVGKFYGPNVLGIFVSSFPCTVDRAKIYQNICRAKILLSAATVQADNLVLSADGETGYSVPQQSEEAAEALAEEAEAAAEQAMAMAGDELSSADKLKCMDSSHFPPDFTVPTVKNFDYSSATDFSSAFAEAYMTAKDAYKRAVEATVNVSDKMRSTSSSPTQIGARSMTGEKLSRAAAAHLLLGGSPGIDGSSDQPLCLHSDLTPESRTALQIFRQAAPDPADVIDTAGVSIDALVNGNLPHGSVRQRLYQFHGDPLLATSAGQVEKYYKLNRANFEAARALMIEETHVFGRLSKAQLRATGPAKPQPKNAPTPFRRYAGTASDPVDLPPAAWAALARLIDPGQTAVAPGPSLSDLIGRADQTISDIRGIQAFPSAIRAEALAPLALIQAGQETLGSLELRQVSFDDGGAWTVAAHGLTKEDRLRIVVGEEGLRCAVRGTIEGASCDDVVGSAPCSGLVEPTLACLTLVALDSEGATAHKDLDDTFVVPPATTHLYLVRPRNAGSTESPGQFEVLAGFRSGNWSTSFNTIPITPALERRVGEVLAPDKKYCALPQVTCAGVKMDARLPLEDELTGDNDGVESSWKHYLALAQQAAAEADGLGNDYINTSLNLGSVQAENEVRQEEQRRRAEEALQSVQSACGTAVDSHRLLSLLSGQADGKSDSKLALATQDRTCDATSPCTGNFSCISGRCALDFKKIAGAANPRDPELERLADCLDNGPESIYPFVTLGDQPLCVAVDPNNSNILCPDASKACPSVQQNNACDESNHERVATPLKYFVTEGDSIAAGTCRAINILRAHPGDFDAMQALQKTGILHPTRIVESVSDIKWAAQYGGYATVSYDSVPRITTGSLEHGPSTEWPCSTINPDPSKFFETVIPSDCKQGDEPLGGLFCSFAHCDHDHNHDFNRGEMNERLLRATLAASLMRQAAAGPVTWESVVATKLTDQFLPFNPGGPYGVLKTRTTRYHHETGSPVFDEAYEVNHKACVTSPFGFDLACVTVAGDRGHHLWSLDAGAGLQWVQANPQGIVRTNSFTPAIDFTNQGSTTFTANDISKFSDKSNPKAEFFSRLSGFQSQRQSDWAWAVLKGRRPPNDAAAPSVNYAFHTPGTSYVHDGTLDGEAFLDGLELLCRATEIKVTGATTAPAGFDTFADISRAADYLNGLSKAITRHAGRMIFANIPKIAIDAGRETQAFGVVPLLGGRMADAVAELRAAELQAKSAVPVITGEMNQFASEFKSLGALLAKNNDLAEIRSLKLQSTVLDRLNECANSLVSVTNVVTFGAKSAINCANSVAQIGLASQINDLESQAAAKDDTIAKADFGGKAALHARALQAAAVSLGEAAEAIDRASADIEGLKKDAQVNLAKAIYLSSWQSQQQAQYLTSLGALKTNKKARYDSALDNARLMANLAKRSIEQRLGVRLSEMRDNLPLVAAPSTWESTACTMSGIDFDKVTEKLRTSNVTGVVKLHNNFTDGFIGDYVTKLSNLVESYRIQHDFHEGSDTAVVSLRDDVFNVRQTCDVPSANLLLRSAALDDHIAWRAMGCNPVQSDGVSQPAMNCISATPRRDGPFDAFDNQLGGATGFDVQFGDGKGCVSPLSAGPCGWQPGVTLMQPVQLSQGEYRFSWYSKPTEGTEAEALVAKVWPDASAALSLDVRPVVEQAPNWTRKSVIFSVGGSGVYWIGFGLPDSVTTAPSTPATLAAAMLERLPADGSADASLPSYERTDATNLVPMQACEDTSGTIFRHTQWQRECRRLCDAGFSNNCTEGPTKCYQQASFGISQAALTNGKLFNFSGFARGNFNYRINSVALNFVGTGIRNCADSLLPSTCNGGGFVTYSLDHEGPFFVRNYDGKDFRAFLFDGHIEQARGLATERYISNPLGSSDAQLLGDYMRKELQGRPLDGNFTVRIWEDDAMDFEAIKDVQVVLNYSYWTRFN